MEDFKAIIESASKISGDATAATNQNIKEIISGIGLLKLEKNEILLYLSQLEFALTLEAIKSRETLKIIHNTQ